MTKSEIAKELEIKTEVIDGALRSLEEGLIIHRYNRHRNPWTTHNRYRILAEYDPPENAVKNLMIDVRDIGRVESVVYVIDETHDQYCDLSLSEQANIIAHAVGGRGSNWEYLRNTVNFLNDSQIYDADLQWLEAEVTQIRGQ